MKALPETSLIEASLTEISFDRENNKANIRFDTNNFDQNK